MVLADSAGVMFSKAPRSPLPGQLQTERLVEKAMLLHLSRPKERSLPAQGFQKRTTVLTHRRCCWYRTRMIRPRPCCRRMKTRALCSQLPRVPERSRKVTCSAHLTPSGGTRTLTVSLVTRVVGEWELQRQAGRRA